MTSTLFAQQGDKFPEMAGVSLTDEQISIPDATEGKYTMVGLAYSKKAEDDLKSWFDPIYKEYVQEGSSNPLIPEMKPDINVVFVPMFTGIKQGASKSAIKKMQKGIDPKLHANVMVYSGKMGEYKEQLGFDKKDVPYFFVLDKEGTIIYATEGKASSKKLDAIYDLVSEF